MAFVIVCQLNYSIRVVFFKFDSRGVIVPRPRISPEMKKVNITLRLPKYIVDMLKDTENYNNLVEVLLKDYFSKK